jgi:ADP-ribose pyrophosphatase YjhB (NUDIX family)
MAVAFFWFCSDRCCNWKKGLDLAVNRKKGWLPEKEWKAIQQRIPISCVDVLLTRTSRGGQSEVGLILREAPLEGRRWCLVGGRILRNESTRAAIRRQIHETLGTKVRCFLARKPEPLMVAEYFSVRRPRFLFDPRQHAIALTFSVEARGAIRPQGEALDFRWFDVRCLLPASSFGFGQKKVVEECIRRLARGA